MKATRDQIEAMRVKEFRAFLSKVAGTPQNSAAFRAADAEWQKKVEEIRKLAGCKEV